MRMKKLMNQRVRRTCLLLATTSGLALIGVATPVTLDPGSLSPEISSAYAQAGGGGGGGGPGGSGSGGATGSPGAPIILPPGG